MKSVPHYRNYNTNLDLFSKRNILQAKNLQADITTTAAPTTSPTFSFAPTRLVSYSPITDISLSNLESGALGYSITGVGVLTSTSFSSQAFAGVGDVSGDGIADYAIASVGSGIVYVLFGSNNNTLFSTLSLSSFTSGANGYRIIGSESYQFGYAISGTGDVNGDNINDMIIGAPNSVNGTSYVVFGRSGVTSYNDLYAANLSSSSVYGYTITGSQNLSYSGSTVSGAGDVNGDGINDLMIGESGYNYSTGDTYVLFGSSLSTDIQLSSSMESTVGYRIVGAAENDLNGYCLSSTGDMNNDGYDDIITVSFLASANDVSEAGIVYVLFGHLVVVHLQPYHCLTGLLLHQQVLEYLEHHQMIISNLLV